jgi:hypothetical protein
MIVYGCDDHWQPNVVHLLVILVHLNAIIANG